MADITLESAANASTNELSGDGRVEAWPSSSNGYVFFVNSAGDKLQYRKSTNGGSSFGAAVDFGSTAGGIGMFTIWPAWWTPGDSGTKIHVWWTESIGGVADLIHATLDTASDTKGTETILVSSIAAGSAANSIMSGCKAVGGNFYLAIRSDDGVGTVYSAFWRGTDETTWGTRTTVFESNALDHVLLFPGDNADTQDIITIFWDTSADEISRKNYDDSANTQTETSISTSMVEPSKANAWPGMAGAIKDDKTIILCAKSGYDSATADMKCWYITGTSVTAKTDVWSNSDDAEGCAVMWDEVNGHIYVAWLGKNDGTQTITNDVHVYTSKSTDGASTWGTPVQHSVTNDDHRLISLDNGSTNTRMYPVWFNDDLNDLLGNFDNSVAIAAAAGGTTPFRMLMGVGT